MEGVTLTDGNVAFCIAPIVMAGSIETCGIKPPIVCISPTLIIGACGMLAVNIANGDAIEATDIGETADIDEAIGTINEGVLSVGIIIGTDACADGIIRGTVPAESICG